ncbi:MAG: glycosyltransferase family 2 protein [Hyphomicrobiaceae bacterium]|nr:glycosyltransferase family 2 protein [Hyphomicrobiaceae bacterium]
MTLRIAVGIATSGRPAILAAMLARLELQSRAPDAILVSAAGPCDLERIPEAFPRVVPLLSPPGSSHQRNAILRHCGSCDVVVFFDDDFIPCPQYLAAVEAVMAANPDVVMTTGTVLRDGATGPGLTFAEADAVLAVPEEWRAGTDLVDVADGYGCNMSARLDIIRRHGLGFDENLPLYAWLEDVDFGHRLSSFGRIVRTPAARGVHLGVKSGRQPGRRVGYSQVANPIYLARKGTCRWRRGLYLMSRNIAANSFRSIRPEAWVDRRGRLAGNLRAIGDLLRGRLDPLRAASL